MKRPLAIVLLLLLAAVTWRIGFPVPPRVSAQEPVDAPLGATLGAGESPAADPFSAGQAQQRGGNSARRAQPPKPGTTVPQWQRPYSQAFQLELTEVADGGLSFNKVRATGTAKVTPVNLTELPKVTVAISAYGGMDEGGVYDGGMYPGGSYGGMMPGGEMGMMGSSGPIPVPDAPRREIEQRITSQAQADWVRQTFRSDVALSEEQRQALKKRFGEVLKKQYAEQLRRQEIELQVVERRLANLRDQLARRAGAADRVVEFELQRLDLEASGLGLGPDAQLQPAGRPGASGMGGGYDGGSYGEGGMF